MKNKLVINNLRVYRKRAGLTQAEVAMKLGFKNYDRFSRWENGRLFPHVINLLKLASLYKVRPDELYTLIYSPEESQACISSRL